MSNRKKLRKPPEHSHEEGDELQTVHGYCSGCGYTEQVDLCKQGVSEYLAERKAEMVFDCPTCKGNEALGVRIGRSWLGEPRFVWKCDNGCAPAAIRVGLLEAGIHPGCLGEYAADGERTALYRMFGAASDLLYIGISKDFGRRWKEEAAAKPWYPEVQRQTVDWFGSRSEAEDAEEAAIKAEHPKYNIVHNATAPAAFQAKAEVELPAARFFEIGS